MKFSWAVIPVFCLVFACKPTPPSTPLPKLNCSFTQAPFINPRVIQELSTWISDSNDQVVAIDLLHSQKSNRFFCDAKVRNVKNQFPYVYLEGDDKNNPSEFGYQYVGRTSSGVYVLALSESDGGSGVFKGLMLVKIERDFSISTDWTNGVVKPDQSRILIKKMGEIQLGDRWDGNLKVDGDSILIGKDEGWYAGKSPKSGHSLKVKANP